MKSKRRRLNWFRSSSVFTHAVGLGALLLLQIPSIGFAQPPSHANKPSAPPGKALGRDKGTIDLFIEAGAQPTNYCTDLGDVNQELTSVFSAPVGALSGNTFIRVAAPVEVETGVVITSRDPSVVVFANGANSIRLWIPAGGIQTGFFQIKGVSVGSTQLHVEFSDPDILAFDTPTYTWDIENIVDYLQDGAFLGDSCFNPDSSPELQSDIEVVKTCGYPRSSITADGASRFLIRIKAGGKGKACFAVIDDGDNNPSISTDGGMMLNAANLSGSAEDVSSFDSNGHWAFGAYVAPNEFEREFDPDGLGRPIRVVKIGIGFNPEQVNGTYNTRLTTALEREVVVQRTPVVLIHGLASSDDMWIKENVVNRDVDGEVSWKIPVVGAPHSVLLFDYRDIHAHPPEPIARRLADELEGYMEMLRLDEERAITRVDIVAHSYGGLVARRYMDDSRDDHPLFYGTGAVRKFATFGSPLNGSIVANFVINLWRNQEHPAIDLNGAIVFLNFWSLFYSINFEAEDFEKLTYGAICALAENSSSGSFDAHPEILTHAYTGSGGPIGKFNDPLGRRIMILLDVDENPSPLLDLVDTHFRPYYWAEPNDSLVALRIAQRSLPGPPFVTHFPSGLHSGAWSGGVSILESMASTITSNLDNPELWMPLPASLTTGDGVPLLGGRGISIDSDNYSTQCAEGGPMNSPPP